MFRMIEVCERWWQKDFIYKHTKWLKKVVKFEPREKYDLNKMSKWSGMEEIIIFWKTARWFGSDRSDSNCV